MIRKTITCNVNGEILRKHSVDEMIKTLDGKAKFARQSGDMDAHYKYDQHSEFLRQENPKPAARSTKPTQ